MKNFNTSFIISVNVNDNCFLKVIQFNYSVTHLAIVIEKIMLSNNCKLLYIETKSKWLMFLKGDNNCFLVRLWLK